MSLHSPPNETDTKVHLYDSFISGILWKAKVVKSNLKELFACFVRSHIY